MAGTRAKAREAERQEDPTVVEQQLMEHGEYVDAIVTPPSVAPAADPGATVQGRMLAILGEMPAIGKNQKNAQQGFMFRGHDDILNALNPLLAKHGVVIVPNVLERITDQRQTRQGGVMYEVNLHVEYTFYGAAGDKIVASTWGEGTDSGDKATNKAMTMAFKNVLNQAFSISSQEFKDADADTNPETVGRDSVRQDVRVDPQPVKPATWGEALKRFDDMRGRPGEGAAWLEELTEKLYGQSSLHEITQAQRQTILIGFSSAVMLMEERYGDLAFQSMVRPLIQQAFAEKNNGVFLEGPAWAIDGTEAETRPSRDELQTKEDGDEHDSEDGSREAADEPA